MARPAVTDVSARRDDEHGTERPWAGFIGGHILQNVRGATRTFSTEAAALAAARRAARAFFAEQVEPRDDRDHETQESMYDNREEGW